VLYVKSLNRRQRDLYFKVNCKIHQLAYTCVPLSNALDPTEELVPVTRKAIARQHSAMAAVAAWLRALDALASLRPRGTSSGTRES
jgi:hypothetical protein